MSNRITIECHACGREFSLFISKEKQTGEYLTTCTFCKVESKIVFNESSVVEVYKSMGRD